MKFLFEGYVLDSEAFTLSRGEQEIAVESRVLETLIFLIRQRHRVISKDELLESVWDIDFASEATLFKAIQQARKAVGDDGRSQKVIKTVHGKGYRFVAGVEENAETTPFAGSGKTEVSSDPLDTGEEILSGYRRWKKSVVIGAAVVLTVLVAWFVGHREAPADHSVRTSVAVLNCVGDPALSLEERRMVEAVPELLFLRLRNGGRLRVIAPGEVAEAMKDLEAEGGADSGKPGVRVFLDRLDCDAVISSRLAPSGKGSLQLQSTIYFRDSSRAQLLSRINARGDVFALAGEVGADLLKALGGDGRKTEKDGNWTPEVQPEAFSRYVAGVNSLRGGDLNNAVSVLAPLVAQFPKFVPARIALAKVYRAMGLKDAAGLEAKTALNFSEDLPAETRLQLEALTSEINGDWGAAARIYRSLWSVTGDENEYPLALIRVLRWDGRSDEALEVAGRIKKSLQRDPRFYLEISRVYQLQGKTGEQRASLEKACAAAEARGTVGRLASALLGLGWVDISEGKLPEAETHFLKAEELFETLGNNRGQARAFKGRATVLACGPRKEESLPLFYRAAQLQRGWGDLEDLAKTLYSVAGVLSYTGNTREALKTGLEVLELSRRTGDREVEGAVLIKIGDAQVDLGNSVEGMETYQEALPILEAQGATRRIANLWNSMGLASEYSGDLSAAVRYFGRSSAMLQDIGEITRWFDVTYNLAWLHLRTGDLDKAANLLENLRAIQADDSQKAAVFHLGAGIAHERGDLKRAGAEVDKAITLREATGEKDALDTSRALRSRIFLAMGRHEQVLGTVERLIVSLRKEDDPLALAESLLLKADALGLASRWNDALECYTEARSIQKERLQPMDEAGMDIEEGRINAHLGNFKQADLNLKRARGIAERSGMALLVMEAEIAGAELLMFRGSVKDASSDLVHLRRKCEGRGWGRLAGQVSALIKNK